MWQSVRVLGEHTHFASLLRGTLKLGIGHYHKMSVLLWRGFGIDGIMAGYFGNLEDKSGKGGQMAMHVGSPEYYFHTISSPLATQIPSIGTKPLHAFTLEKAQLQKEVSMWECSWRRLFPVPRSIWPVTMESQFPQ
ncbi:hypothetical protein F5141DRAFT_1106153 [Pisolithus sp. B1]|nr:hypothetical protein F5141DRAFT_1106153 [Pisolithus sp. B1]